MSRIAQKRNLWSIEDEKRWLSCLDVVLRHNGISEMGYAICEEADSAVCIDKDGNGWNVFDMERGNKYRNCFFFDIRQACNCVIERVTSDMTQERKIKDEIEQKFASSNVRHGFIRKRIGKRYRKRKTFGTAMN